MTGFNFDEQSVKRISRTVNIVEHQNKSGRVNGRVPKHSTDGRYIKITDGEDFKYSWKPVSFNEDGNASVEDDWEDGDHTIDYGYAVEVLHKSEYVLKDSIVWAIPCPGNDYFIFEYHPGICHAVLEAGEVIPADGSAEVKLSLDGSSEYEETIMVFNGYGKNIETDGTNDVGLQIGYGDRGKWWLVGVDCG
ncbi:MAG: hypothetical protein WDZ51_06130 [Pirellulaceae bacterium]